MYSFMFSSSGVRYKGPIWFLFLRTIFENRENIILGLVWFMWLKTVFENIENTILRLVWFLFLKNVLENGF